RTEPSKPAGAPGASGVLSWLTSWPLLASFGAILLAVAAGSGLIWLIAAILLLSVLGVLALAWRAGRRVTVEPVGTLEALASAVADGLAATGGVRPELGAGAVRVGVRADGYYRCVLSGATLEES